ncbi:MAG: hypothetical protein LBD11_08230 [Candidatus Peribacteria bacterium]|jgi:hypothetical protein|nr:hypothetical protein [Candidatus Peribacteria bacterium]
MELEQQEKLEIYQIYCKDFFREPDFFEIEYSVEEQKIEKAKRLKEIPAG